LLRKALLPSLCQIPKAFGTLWQRGKRGDFTIYASLLITLSVTV
jgi:hypothetical protein